MSRHCCDFLFWYLLKHPSTFSVTEKNILFRLPRDQPRVEKSILMPTYKNYNLETTSDSWEIKRFYIKCQDSLDYIHLRRISLQISNILNKRLPIFFFLFFFLLRRHEKYQRWLFSVNYFEIHSLSNSFRKVQ